jgi:hypothetical protein
MASSDQHTEAQVADITYLPVKNANPISSVMATYCFQVVEHLRRRHHLDVEQACTSVITWLADVMEAQADGLPANRAADTIVYLQRSQVAEAIRQK